LLFHEAVNNPYWQAVKRVIVGLSAAKVNGRLETFRQNLVQDLYMEAQEKELGQKVSERLKGVAVMEGVFNVDVEVRSSSTYMSDIDADYIHGYKLFNSSYAPTYQPDIPKWVKKRFWEWLGITALVQKSANELASARAKHSAQITSFSKNLERDLLDGFRVSILPNFKPTAVIADGSVIKFTLYFNYSSKGLFINPLTVVHPNHIGFSWQLN